MKILAINISHNPSVCSLLDGKILNFYDETRFNRFKQYVPGNDLSDSIYYKSIEKKFLHDEFDQIIFASYGAIRYYQNVFFDKKTMRYRIKLDQLNRDEIVIKKFQDQLKSKFPKVEKYVFQNEHHLYHALCGYNFSNYDDAVCIVMDGGGVSYLDDYPTYQEIESVYRINKKNIKLLYKHLSNVRTVDLQFCIPKAKNIQTKKFKYKECQYKISSEESCGFLFNNLTHFLKIEPNEELSGLAAGKTMGLAAYGNIRGEEPADLAKKLQNITFKKTCNLIDYAVNLSGCKNIILSGGYAMNCLNNYRYIKKFPRYNFFVDPCAHDGGTAIGAAIWLYRKLNNNI